VKERKHFFRAGRPELQNTNFLWDGLEMAIGQLIDENGGISLKANIHPFISITTKLELLDHKMLCLCVLRRSALNQNVLKEFVICGGFKVYNWSLSVI